MDKLIYFIRHGQTDYNLKHIIQGSGVDSELNDTGKAQAKAFYNYYHKEAFEFVYASGLKRAQQTIQSFLGNDLPYQFTPLINEINWGIHEGQAYNTELISGYKGLIQKWKEGNFEASVEGGESAKSLGARCNTFLANLHHSPAKKILVCTHGRTLRCLMSIANGETLADMENYQHHNTGLYLTRLNSNGFELLERNNIDHLESVDAND